MKTVSKTLVGFASLLALESSLPLVSAQSDQIFCDPTARPVFCTPAYNPVCAYSYGCNNSLCSYTAINSCAACGQSDISYYTLGECFYNSQDVDEYFHEESGNSAEGESPEEGHAPETELEIVVPEEGQTPETEISPEEGILPETELSPEEGNLPETELSPEEGNVPETEEQTGEQETEVEVEQPVEEEKPTEEVTQPSENEESSGSNCPTTGVLIYVNGKFIRGDYCCGAPKDCHNKVSPVCGSLNQCVGSLCRQTKINNCNACQDPNVKLYFPGTCRQLFGDAEVILDGGDDSENTELNTEEEELNNGGFPDDDFRLLKLDEDWLNINLD